MSDKDMIIKTPEEAIETIKSNMPTSGYQMLRESLVMAIEALEKQKLGKPVPINHKNYADKIANAEFLEDAYFCPNCKKVLRSGSYCNSCGQKLCWNENLEEAEDEKD